MILLFILSLTFSLVLSSTSSNAPPLHVPQLPIKLNDAFTFKIINRVSPVEIDRNPRGTFFRGNFSTLFLAGGGSIHQYTATQFTLKYPRQHIVTRQSQEGIQLQIMYTLEVKQNVAWKHKRVVMSVSFVTTEYVPSEGFVLSKQIPPTISNGSKIDFNKLLPLVSGLKTYLYKGIHSDHPEDKAFLWMIRTELLLMSKLELQYLLEIAGSNQERKHGLIKKISDLNQISEMQEEKTKPRTEGQF